MLESHDLWAVLFAATAGVALVLATATWQHRATRGARPLTLLMAGVTIWAGASSGVWFGHTLADQTCWLRVTYLGRWMIPVGFLTLALDIARMDRWHTASRTALIASPPILLTILAWVNPGGGYHKEFTGLEVGVFTRYVSVPGPLYWTYAVVGLAMVALGFAILVRAYVRSSGTERGRVAILLVGASLPFLASIVSEFGLVALNGIDPAPLAFLATGALWIYGLSRGRLLDVLPLARDALVEQMSDGVVVLDDAGLVADANPAALSMLQVSRTVPVGQPAAALLDGLVGVVASVRESVIGGSEATSHAVVPMGCIDDCRYVDYKVTALDLGPRARPAHLVVLHDVTEEREKKQLLATAHTELERSHELIVALNEKLREQAIRDPLTSLYNRRFLDDRLPVEIARARREAVSLAFLLVDIDDFKQANDSHSHAMGDAALKMVAEELLAGARMADVVSRYGGDEFLVIMVNADGLSARARGDEFRRRIQERRLVLDHDECTVTVSIGVASVPANGLTAEDAIAAADGALYRAKEAGRNAIGVAPDQKGQWPLTSSHVAPSGVTGDARPI
ncbi:MAG TPA: hypothetical protein DCP20_03020 [Coriobacteriia bacterium]|nr:MAG: Diguanylate cyclase with PAS/PAC sensor [Actinobacteria bacterium 66_15]HAL29673.1 hypothetical protein [Coriobacteriia bacterium]